MTTRSARSGGLVTELSCRRVTVSDFSSSDSELDGLASYQTEGSRFTGLNLHDNLAAGLSFDIAFNNNMVDNSILTSNATVAS